MPLEASLWEFGGLTPLELLKRTFRGAQEDDIVSQAAALSYYFLLALFPLLMFLISLLGVMAGPGTELRQALTEYMTRAMPGAAAVLVNRTLSEVSHAASGSKLAFGLLAALWAASGGMTAIVSSLNVAYDVSETRPWWKQKAVAILLTLAISVLVISALVLVLFGGRIAEWVAAHVGLGGVFVLTWKIAQWPLVLGVMLLAFAIVYYFAPNLKVPSWHWITPGACLGLFVWIAASGGLRVYLHFFDSYSKTYGSLGAVIILMLWLYLSGVALLIGAELNSEIGHAAEAHAVQEERLRSLEKDLAA